MVFQEQESVDSSQAGSNRAFERTLGRRCAEMVLRVRLSNGKLGLEHLVYLIESTFGVSSIGGEWKFKVLELSTSTLKPTGEAKRSP